MSDLFAVLPDDGRDLLRPSPPPDWVPPMLATLTARRFSGPEWLFERKFDGERCLGYRRGGDVRLLSRNRKRLDDTYPEVAEALAGEADADLVVDGEIVAFEGGRTSFDRLQRRLEVRDREAARRARIAVFYYVFDLLHLGGYDTTDLPLRLRKRLLRRALTYRPPLRYSAHRNADGEAFHREACSRGWEGVIAKGADSRYVGRRSPDWLKFKCANQQDVVVGGFTEPAGSRIGFGALLVGYHAGGDLVYAGKVGTGYNTETLFSLRRRLDALRTDEPPFTGVRASQGGVHWVHPELVAQVAFTEWTEDAKLRHPRFLGLRRDKAPGDVVRELPTQEP
jgi:bifunctional non-homologous end joining protein LigD